MPLTKKVPATSKTSTPNDVNGRKVSAAPTTAHAAPSTTRTHQGLRRGLASDLTRGT
jgi:hypothetical protein